MLRRGAVYWKRSALVFVVIALASLAYVMTGPRSYKSETVILYQESIRSGDLVGGGDGTNESARRVGARLKEMLNSRAILEPLITELKLYPATVESRGLVDAVDEMRKHVAFRAREGDTFEISFESNSRELAQEVTKRLAEVIVQEASSRRAEQAKTLKEFLDAESDRNQIDLRNKEGELAKFLALHPDFARPTLSDVHSPLPGPSLGPGTGAGVASGDPMLAALEWKASRIDRQLKAGSGAPEPAPPPKPRAAPPSKLPDSAELVAARKDVEDKAGRYTDKHPDVVAARARLRTAEAAQASAQAAADQAAAAAAAAAAGGDQDQTPVKPATDANREALTKQLADLRQQIAARRAAGGTAGTAKRVDAPALPSDNHGAAVDLEVEFRRLQREAAEARDRQRQLDDKKFKASITASSVMNDRNIQVSVLDPAYLPTHPSSRPRSTTLGVGLLIAFILALATALVSARLDDRIHDRIDLEALDIMPILGVIPAPKQLPRKSG
ncbi:MAG: Lipopolysaccharide biosynthesis chain length determinant protein [Myxococcaceae bacterium]|nr:Lipopolysaccharide biosynthesis chain length determinant protein [Myxococcaceae bacterium]